MASSASRFGEDLKNVVEDALERHVTPKKLKRFLELIGPFLLVITYVEDAFRCAPRSRRARTARLGPSSHPARTPDRRARAAWSRAGTSR